MPVTDIRPAYTAIFVVPHPGLGSTWVASGHVSYLCWHCNASGLATRCQIKQTKLERKNNG
jgi:hypothetical protein